MGHRQWLTPAITLLALGPMILTGCTAEAQQGGSASPRPSGSAAPATLTASPAPAPSASDPRATLTAAIDLLRTTRYWTATTIGSNLRSSGVVDRAAGTSEIRSDDSSGGTTTSVTTRCVGKKVWQKFDMGKGQKFFGVPADKWVRLISVPTVKNSDPTLACAGTFESDLLKDALDTVRWLGPGHYTATVDLSDVILPLWQPWQPVEPQSQLNRATAAPADLTLDRQQRLTGLTVRLDDAAKDLFIIVSFSAYGDVPAVKPPAAKDVVDGRAFMHGTISGTDLPDLPGPLGID